ncbi:MAG: glycosyltransferase [Lachnospiraceae bacterium]|nr:glycosyltransferase [Lachnospiraceae bacterium]
MIRVLVIAPLGIGGITSMMLNIQKRLNPMKIHFDYLVFRNEVEAKEDEIVKLGSKKYVVDVSMIHSKFIARITKLKLLKELCKKNTFDVLYINAEPSYEVLLAVAAKAGGVKKVIYHSHNASGTYESKIKTIMHAIFKVIMTRYIDKFIACSEKAAHFSFPTKIVKNHEYTILKNGIDADKFKYNHSVRLEMRKKFEIEEKYVVGHVGRFSTQKNHKFLIDIFFEIHKKDKSAVLLLLGTGELLQEVQKKIISLNLEDSVIYLGTSDEMEKIWQSMDVFLFPSLYEGLPVAGIEAQAAGLPIVASDSISDELAITDLVEFVSLNNNAEYWADKVLKKKAILRDNQKDKIEKAGYGIESTVKQITNIIENLFSKTVGKHD